MELFDEAGSEEIVLKPVVGANADDLLWLARETSGGRREQVQALYGEKPVMVQPLVRAVMEEGEYSLFFFEGQFSHGILKKAKPGDLRVQEEHGGHPVAVAVGPALLAAGWAAIRAVPEVPLYARVDLVRSNDRRHYWLMELELIEPALYLRMDREAPGRLAAAFQRRIQG